MPSKISTLHRVGPRKSVSNRAPHMLTPALAQLITPENDLYDDHVSAEDWNLLFDASDDEDD